LLPFVRYAKFLEVEDLASDKLDRLEYENSFDAHLRPVNSSLIHPLHDR